MKLVSQPYHSKQCGQACLAMITEKSLEEVCKDLNNYMDTSIYSEIINYLNKSGFSTQLVECLGEDFNKIPNESMVHFMFQNAATHVAVKFDDLFFDPDVGIVKEYDNKVKVLRYIKYKKL